MGAIVVLNDPEEVFGIPEGVIDGLDVTFGSLVAMVVGMVSVLFGE